MRVLNRAISTNWLSASRQLEFRQLTSWLDARPDDTILDIGCGDGYWTVRWAHSCAHATGLDPNASRITAARARGSDSASFVVGDATAMPFDASTFDKVASMCVFEHIPDDMSALLEVFRVLRPGGTFVLSVDAWGVPLRTRSSPEHRRRYSVARYYTPTDLLERLELAGFEYVTVIDMITTHTSVVLHDFRMRHAKAGRFLSPLTSPVELVANRLDIVAARPGLKLCARACKPAPHD